MEKEVFYNAYKSIGEIEKSLDKVTDIWNTIPREIQNAIIEFHNEDGNLAHCLRWGLQAATEVRENWPKIMSEFVTDEESESSVTAT
jgi:hypothetical protein